MPQQPSIPMSAMPQQPNNEILQHDELLFSKSNKSNSCSNKTKKNCFSKMDSLFSKSKILNFMVQSLDAVPLRSDGGITE